MADAKNDTKKEPEPKMAEPEVKKAPEPEVKAPEPEPKETKKAKKAEDPGVYPSQEELDDMRRAQLSGIKHVPYVTR